ncbi:MAG: hypothetical protein ILP02_02345, partial [Clostridia bacterium]|nr:hypothetical protein [Clostridia bacterium]
MNDSVSKVREYISQGMTEAEAMKQVAMDNVDEDIEAFASAFFSAVFGAAGVGAMTGVDIRDYVNQHIDEIIDSDNNVVDQEALENLIETGLSEEFSKTTQKKAEALQQKLANGEEITQKEVKSLYTENVQETRSDKFEDNYVEETEDKAESLRTPSNLAELLERQTTAEGLKNLKNTLGSEGQKLCDNAIAEAMQNRANTAQAYREVTNVYNAGAGVTNTYTATHLTADTTQALYKAGIADRETYAAQEANNRLVKNVSAGVAETPALTQAIEDGRVSTKTRNALDSLGKKLGTRIEIYNSNAEYNGQYNPNDSTIRLYLDSTLLKSADTDTILRATAGHEITHRLQSLSSKHYESLVKTVADTMGSEFSNAVNKYKAKGSRLSNAQAQDEVIADFVGRKIFTDDAFVDRLVNNIATSDTTVAEKKSALQSLKDFFHKIASWIGGNKDTDVSIDRIREIEDKIDSIIKAGVENLKNAEAVMADDIGNVSDAVFSIKYKDAIAERQQTYYENNKGKYAKDFGS